MTPERRRRAETSTTEAVERSVVRTLSDVVSDVVMTFGDDGLVRWLNARATDLWRRPATDLRGTPVRELVAGEGPEPWLEAEVEDPRPVDLHALTPVGPVPVTGRVVDVGDDRVLVLSRRRVATPALPGTVERLQALEAAVRGIGWELQALGFEVRPSGPDADGIPDSNVRNLSRREREVLDRFLDGSTVAQTAASLHVSEHTIRSHLKAIYRKLGVRSQTELVMRMRRPAGRP